MKELLQQCLDALQNHNGNYKLNREECKKQEALEDAIEQALAQQEQPADAEQKLRIDKSWAQFCAGIGDGPKAPYPGMIAAFEAHYAQSFADKDWRSEAGVWAAAWKAAKAQQEQPAQEPVWEDGTDPLVSGGLVKRGRVDNVIRASLYTAPPTQPALSDSQLNVIFNMTAGYGRDDYISFARAIEAHCRGGAKHG